MKKYLVILVTLLVTIAFILPACSTPTPATTAPASTTAKPTTSAPAPSTSAAPKTTTAPTSSAPASQAAAVKKLKFAYTMPKGASIGVGFEWFGPAFEKATNGRYKVEIYPGSTLIPATATLDSVKSGAVEMAYTSWGNHPKQFPLSLVVGPPGLGFPAGTIKMYSAGHDAYREFVDTVPEIQNEIKDWKLLLPLCLDPYKLVSKKKEIKSAADFKGTKIGGSGPKMEVVIANGGAKVQMAPPDSYLNLDKGVVDACFVTFGQVNDYKLQEIASFYSNQGFGNGSGIIIMNQEFYNGMGAADQKILNDTWRAARDVSSQGSLDSCLAGEKGVAAAGKKIYTSTAEEAKAWDAAASPAIDSWRKDAKAFGYTDAVLDSVLAKWKTIRTKYLAIGNAP